MQPAYTPTASVRRRARVRASFALLLLACAATAAAQSATPTTAEPLSNASPAPADAGCHCAPAGSPLLVEITDTLVSDENKPGESFSLRLAEPVIVDGVELVPAGTTGRGEIVHAAKARGGGQPGELLLAARYLDFKGHRIALRGMKLGASGTDRAGAASGTAIAIGAFAQFIHGGEMRVPAGTRAPAKLGVALDAATLGATVMDPTSTATPSQQE